MEKSIRAFFFLSHLLIHVHLVTIPGVRLYVHNLHLYCWVGPDGITMTLLLLWNLKEEEHLNENIALLYLCVLTCLLGLLSDQYCWTCSYVIRSLFL